MAEYFPESIEKKWQKIWNEKKTFRADNDSSKPKYYVLDMFPYPSGAGLHVGHPLGYIASDIIARYKRNKGFNVLHPMGFDSFGLPAEQYAIQTGQHPAKTTAQNIARYKKQLNQIGFSFDWDREVQTSNPDYYKWTQWIFSELFNCYYDNGEDRALPITKLINLLEKDGNEKINASCDPETPVISSQDWKNMSEKERADFLLNYRLTYLAETEVNWCPALGTVLANDEVKDGVSERGGHPVERKKMRQWMMRITAYAQRLLDGLEKIDWPDPLKEMQRNWIGRSKGCSLTFKVADKDLELKVFTTRVDTSFGVTFMTIAPEHELVDTLTSNDQQKAVDEYVNKAKNRSERDRMSDVKTISGVFTGSYAINPFNNEKIPIWIADYVLAGYGTGVVMAVPSSDERDYRFAKHFGLKIIPVQEGEGTDISKEDFDPKKGTMINSGFLNGLEVPEAIDKAIAFVEKNNLGKATINYKMRDAVFSRQRYWGEPVPVYFKNEIPELLPEQELPLLLPEVDEYLPTETGEPPLGRAKNWKYKEQYDYELSTMPGWAGSSWYHFRYMDPENGKQFAGKEALSYWQDVDFYMGGSEHATGHLLYSRFWSKFLYDRDFVPTDEPYKKLINHGMIQGMSSLVYRIKDSNNFVSKGLKDQYETVPMHVDISMVNSKDELDLEAFKQWRPDLNAATFILEDGKYMCGSEVEKMSKRYYNVVNPDDIVAQYGADTLRLYEMFLGPIEQAKPWNTHGIDGVIKFLRKFWRLFHDQNDNYSVSEGGSSKEELKILHKTIKKVTDDIERYSFNTVVSTLMICVNDLSSLKTNKKEVLEPLVILISPLAPHIAEELWQLLGHAESVVHAPWPVYNEKLTKDEEIEYPISINGKVRAKMKFSADAEKSAIEEEVLAAEVIQKWLEGKKPKKIIVVPKKIVNVVV